MSRQPEPQPVQCDPRYFRHRKSRSIRNAAKVLHLRAIFEANLHLTDGRLTHEEAVEMALDVLAHDAGPLAPPTPGDAHSLVFTLVAARLFDEVDGGYAIHDYAEYQTPRAVVEQRRSWRLRKQQARSSGTVPEPGWDSPGDGPREPHAVNSNSTHSSLYPSSTATAQLAAVAVELPGNISEAVDAVARSENDPVGYVVARLADSQGHRTTSAIRSVLSAWDLPDACVLEAFRSLQAMKARGDSPRKGEAAYLVGTLRRMGEKGRAVA